MKPLEGELIVSKFPVWAKLPFKRSNYRLKSRSDILKKTVTGDPTPEGAKTPLLRYDTKH